MCCDRDERVSELDQVSEFPLWDRRTNTMLKNVQTVSLHISFLTYHLHTLIYQ